LKYNFSNREELHMPKKLTKNESDKQPEIETSIQTSHTLFGSMIKELLIPLNLEV